jgi:hypothetical protein
VDVVIGASTTTADVLWTCSERLGGSLNANMSVLLEVCSHLGLERRLRRYERIRDVLNSWDLETQNALVVSSVPATAADADLDLASVPQTEIPPSGFGQVFYHSRDPIKWKKRYLTLSDGGQLVSSKKLEPRPSDRDTQNLCHLSDFDIYIPTEVQVRKKLKAPKKYCFAIKSQQKTTVFINTENYVHYFCTDDATVAKHFCSEIQ